jgi:hypothetical protein
MPSTLGTVPGVQDGQPLFRSCAWHTYNWANYGPVYAGLSFTAISVASVTGTTVAVTFTPAFSGTAKVRYTQSSRGTEQSSPPVSCTAGTPATITLVNLNPSTQYAYYIAQMSSFVDQTGQTVIQPIYSDEYEFSTAGAGQAAPVITNVVVTLSGGVGNRTATITWQTNVPCLNKVNYGATVSYGSTRADTQTPANQTGAVVAIGKLTAGNTYHYQCASTGRDYAHGLTATTADNTFVA